MENEVEMQSSDDKFLRCGTECEKEDGNVTASYMQSNIVCERARISTSVENDKK